MRTVGQCVTGQGQQRVARVRRERDQTEDALKNERNASHAKPSTANASGRAAIVEGRFVSAAVVDRRTLNDVLEYIDDVSLPVYVAHVHLGLKQCWFQQDTSSRARIACRGLMRSLELWRSRLYATDNGDTRFDAPAPKSLSLYHRKH
jgi:hypothetical protein